MLKTSSNEQILKNNTGSLRNFTLDSLYSDSVKNLTKDDLKL